MDTYLPRAISYFSRIYILFSLKQKKVYIYCYTNRAPKKSIEKQECNIREKEGKKEIHKKNRE